ncbi:hypothetical protein [Virgisporangium ochraceum]|nr:hypothetical protein [Virgisporangium ochraceum]
MKAVLRWLSWLWATRNCQHPRTRPIHGDERNYAAARCLDCGKALG